MGRAHDDKLKGPGAAGWRRPALAGAALAVLLVASGFGCGGTAAYNYRKEPDPRGRGFVLGPADELQITVWKNPALSTSTVVRPDGVITMPLIGDIVAKGLKPAQLREQIKRRLATYIKDGSAVVTVAVTRVNSYRFTVSGKVSRPGLFTAPRYVTVREAVAMAGGPTRFAATEQIFLVRRSKRRVRRIPVDYEAVAMGRKLEQNLVILAGDVIYVP